ncbi:MAG: PAS domain S-box protein, partial [Elusimicrobiaceae bacterium]|nr:PAS domain S-box protein [Elusimicrobiaceae bacterium]
MLLTEEHKVMYANRALCRILGYNDLKELIGTPVLDLVSPDDQELLKEKYEAVLSSSEETDNSINITLRKKNGQAVEVEFSAIASRYLGRRIVLCFVRDITELNRARRELLRERESYRLAFEKASVPSFVLRNNGYISMMNAACREMFGFKEEDKNFYRNVYIKPGLRLAVRRKLALGEPAQMNYKFDFDRAAAKFPGRIAGGKKPLELHLSFAPIYKHETQLGAVQTDYVVSIVSPDTVLSQQTDTQPMVKLLRKPLPPSQVVPAVAAREMLVLPNSEPYVLCGPNFKMLTCNDLFCELCQLTEQELIGQDIRHIIDEESKPQFESDLLLLTDKGTLSNRDYFINPASGLEKIAVRLTAIREEGDRYLFVLRNQTMHLQLIKVLEERSAQLNALLESTNGIVFSVQLVKGKFGVLDNVSQHLSKKLGFTQDELTRKQFKDLFVNTKAAKVSNLLATAQKELNQQGTTSFVGTLACKDETKFEAQVTVTALDLTGQSAALVVLRDISAERDSWSR